MTLFENFRQKYPDKLPVRCMQSKCAFCRFADYPYHIFIKEELYTAGNAMCNYKMQENYSAVNVNHTGIWFFGKALSELKELNKYVITVENHEDPSDPRDEMYLMFYARKSLALKVTNHFKELSPDYSYLIFDDVKKVCVDSRLSKLDRSYVNIMAKETGSHFPNRWREEMESLFEGEDKLVKVVISDDKLERRDLNKNVLEFLEKNCEDLTKRELPKIIL